MNLSLPMYENWQDPKEQFRHIELEINVACDLACFACDRFSDVTTAPNMTVDQVRLFINESLELGWRWERIRLLGGEPTIHPQFDKMIEELLRYRKEFPDVFLQVLTNGHGKARKYREWLEGLNISLHAEAKTKGVTPLWFNNTRITPVDRDPDVGAVPPCSIFGVRGCGIGLTRHGYFLDGAGAAVARVAGHDVGIMRLKDVTWDAMMEQSAVLCRHCGHWNPFVGMVSQQVTETGEVTGVFWTEKLKQFKKQAPVLRVYGSSSMPLVQA